jgi:hypothetical protein
MEQIQSKSFKRAVAVIAGLALPVLNSKLGLGLSSEEVVAGITLVGGYILQSAVNDMHARAAGVEAAAKVTTTADAIAAMKAAGEEGREVSK